MSCKENLNIDDEMSRMRPTSAFVAVRERRLHNSARVMVRRYMVRTAIQI